MKFTIERTSNKIEVFYYNKLFLRITSLTNITDEEIRKALHRYDRMSYMSIDDCCTVLGLLGMGTFYD
jgi:hypothetical protein